MNHSWPKGKYHILWIIINDNKDKIYIYQNAGIECKYEEAVKHRRYDLVIEIDLYRIKHLFEKSMLWVLCLCGMAVLDVKEKQIIHQKRSFFGNGFLILTLIFGEYSKTLIT